jgi:LAO/AO transport system kinase
MPDAAVTAPVRRRRLTAAEYVEGIRAENRYTLARAITLVESTRPDDTELAVEVIESCLPLTGNARRIGISGAPGVGKSTFLEALGVYLTRDREESLAVLSIDPSSPVSGGSILGDKTRMEKLATHERAFVRPSPSGGQLGGVARHTREAMLLCEAAGFQNIFIETVGVGQSEVAVRSMVDTFLLLMLAGAGDDLQGIKRGITELTDVVAINKADGENMLPADRACSELQLALQFFPPGDDGWRPRVLPCSALTNRGISEVWDCVLDHQSTLAQSGMLQRQRSRQMTGWMNEIIRQGLEAKFREDARVRDLLPAHEADVRDGKLSCLRAARDLLQIYHRKD